MMATDRVNETVALDDVYVVAGAVKRIEGTDDLLVVLGSDGHQSIRVRPAEVVKVDKLIGRDIIKPVNTARSSTTTPAADPHLALVLQANRTYALRAVIFFDTNADADFRWKITGPASPTSVRIHRRWLASGASDYGGEATDTVYTTDQTIL